MCDMKKLNNAIGENIRGIREREGLSLSQFGRSINKSPSTVSGYEAGSIVPEFDVITKIAQLYGVSVGHILGIEWSPVSHKTLRKLYEIYLNEVNV